MALFRLWKMIFPVLSLGNKEWTPHRILIFEAHAMELRKAYFLWIEAPRILQFFAYQQKGQSKKRNMLELFLITRIRNEGRYSTKDWMQIGRRTRKD